MFAMRSLLVLLLCGLPVTAQELFPGVSREFRIDPVSRPTLLGNLTVQVPAGTQWAILTSLTEGPEQDVDLYVRFGRPVEMAGNGEVLADFRSESPAGPDEHVFINPSTAPPLQNGLYFVAWVVRSLEVEVRLTVRAGVTRGGAETTRVISTFDNGNDEGWRRNFPPSSIEGSSTGDSSSAIAVDPEGFLRLTDSDGPARDYVVAPPKFLGNLAGFSDPYFEFELRYFEGADPTFPIEVRLIGAGTAYRFLAGIPEPGKWTRVHAPLSSGSWRRVEGVAPFQTVLQNVQRIEVSMDHAPGPEVNDLDNFRFNGGALPPPSGPGGPDFSDFETGVDGWTRNFPASAIPFASFGSENAAVLHGLGGNQSDGFLLLVDGGGRHRDFAVAPEKFIRGLAEKRRGDVAVFPFRMERGYLEAMAGATYAVMPSLYEPFGAATEAYLAGTPVVARATGGLTGQVADYQSGPQQATGFLFREKLPLGASWPSIIQAAGPEERTGIPLYAMMAEALFDRLQDAARLWRADRRAYARLLGNLFDKAAGFSGERAAAGYHALYETATHAETRL